MLVIFGDTRSLEQDELQIRRKALRGSVLILGWWYLMSASCYIILYFLVHANSEGHTSLVIQGMTLSVTPLAIAKGIALIKGATEERLCPLEIGLWLCVIVALYNTILGIMGASYFLRDKHLTVHFVLAILYINLSLSLIFIMCYDLLIIVAYKKLLRSVRT